MQKTYQIFAGSVKGTLRDIAPEIALGESGNYKDNQVRTNVIPSFTRGEGWYVQKQLENSGSDLNCYGCFLLYYVLGSHGNLDVRGHFAMQLDGH